jgi:hypothetical protein
MARHSRPLRLPFRRAAHQLHNRQTFELGLSPGNQIPLAVTLVLCILTCTTDRTNALNGLSAFPAVRGLFHSYIS